jgi:polyhydroxyalkanoate synthesis repressor PhaR
VPAGLTCARINRLNALVSNSINLKKGEALVMNQIENLTIKPSSKIKIIKRYQNRKLYDTQQSCYVTLDDIAKMIRTNEEVMVIDNKSKNDITAATLTQIIFESEKKASQYAPLFTLREIIQNANGSISSYLAKLGAFPIDYMTKQATVNINIDHVSTDDLKQNIENRVASAARLNSDSTSKVVADKATVLPGLNQDDETPNLPLPSSQNFNP